MIKNIWKFFYPETSVYTYNLRKEYIVIQIQKVLNRNSGFFEDNDICGNFIDQDTFEIGIRQAAFTKGGISATKLVGKIYEFPDGNSQVILKAHPSYGYYFWFCIAIISGFGFLYKFFQTEQFGFLVKSFVALIIGSILCIGISNVVIAAISERYIMYIHEKLKT